MKLNLGDIRFHLTNHGFWGVVNFCNLVRKQRKVRKAQRVFFWKQMGQIQIVTQQGKKNLKFLYVENSFQQFTKSVKPKSIGNPFYKK
jgi:hypothetical protein